MKDKNMNEQNKQAFEDEFLDKVLFDQDDDRESTDSEKVSENDLGFPLIDPPKQLSERLYAITENEQEKKTTSKSLVWKYLGAVAASVLLVAFTIQFEMNRREVRELRQAVKDLHIAMEYLEKTNKQAEEKVMETLNVNLKKATVKPIYKTTKKIRL